MVETEAGKRIISPDIRRFWDNDGFNIKQPLHNLGGTALVSAASTEIEPTTDDAPAEWD